MIQGMWGKKVGMTQLFSEANKVVPVTAIDVSCWRIVQIKTKSKDAYSAIQVGCVRNSYANSEFSPEWLSDCRKYFSALREITLLNDEHDIVVGQKADIASIINAGDTVDVCGLTIGRGFQGAMKRHGFSGGRASHGDRLGRGPGALSFMRKQGRVPKGKEMPGHMGVERRVIKNLEIVRIDPTASVVFVKGSVPGKTGSLVFVRKVG